MNMVPWKKRVPPPATDKAETQALMRQVDEAYKRSNAEFEAAQKRILGGDKTAPTGALNMEEQWETARKKVWGEAASSSSGTSILEEYIKSLPPSHRGAPPQGFESRMIVLECIDPRGGEADVLAWWEDIEHFTDWLRTVRGG